MQRGAQVERVVEFRDSEGESRLPRQEWWVEQGRRIISSQRPLLWESKMMKAYLHKVIIRSPRMESAIL